MRTYSTLLLFFALLLFMQSGYADSQFEKDSLRAVIASLEGDEKLKAYSLLGALYFDESVDPVKRDSLFAIFGELDVEAKKQGNLKYQGTVRANILNVLLNNQEYDEVFRKAPVYLRELEEIEAWQYYYHAYSTLSKACLYSGNISKAIEESEQMYERVQARGDKVGMGLVLYSMYPIYAEQKRYEEAEKVLRQSYDLLKDNDQMYHQLTDICSSLSEVLTVQERYEEAIEAAHLSQEAQDRYVEAVGAPMNYSQGNIWGKYIKIYSLTGEYDKAEEYCNKLEELMDSPYFNLMVYNGRARIFNGRGQYNEAIEMIEKAEAIDNGESTMSTNAIRRIKLKSLMHLNRPEEAYAVFEDFIHLSDSIRDTEFATQLDDLHTRYEVDLHIAQKEKKQQQLIGTIVLCSLLLVMLIIYIIYSRRLKKKNVALYKQIQGNLRKESQQTEQPEQPEESQSKEMGLFLRFNELIIKEKLFTHANIDRRTLADRLNTNEKYLSNAIREGYGESLSAYLSKLRLQYALRLLNEHPDLTFEIIAMQSGHGSYTSFYRAFSKQYGITPSEYVKIHRQAAKN